MKQKYNYFSFFETNKNNLGNQVKKFLKKNQNLNIQFLKTFPPCIINISNEKHNGILTLSDQFIVVSNNLYYGNEYRDINKVFKNSPYVSGKCKKCEHFKSSKCRGLFNRKFLEKKKEIEARIGKENYNALRSDYENGILTFSSVCCNNCEICYNSCFTNETMKFIPFLKPSEISHFIHYLPKKIKIVGDNLHCKRGDIKDSPYFNEILRILKYIMTDPRIVSIHDIKENMIIPVKNSGIELSIFIYKFKIEGNKILSATKVTEYIEKINLLRDHDIPYNVCFFPVNSAIKTGDLFKAIEILRQNDPDCKITVHNPYLMFPVKTKHILLSKDFVSDLTINQKELSKKLNDKYQNINLGPTMKESEYLKDMNNKLKICCSDKECFIPVTEDSSLGFSEILPETLTINDYIRSIKKEKGIFDCIAIPRESFDTNLDDLTLANINDLWEEIKEKTHSLILI